MTKYTKRIRDIREDKDISQVNIAKALGINQRVYSRYETGANELPIRHLITLCKLYNISADYILGFTDEPKPLPPIKNKKI